jgi:hypothetical protein
LSLTKVARSRRNGIFPGSAKSIVSRLQ